MRIKIGYKKNLKKIGKNHWGTEKDRLSTKIKTCFYDR